MQGLITYCESFIRLPNKYAIGTIALVGGKLFKFLGNRWIEYAAVNGTTVIDTKTKNVYKVINKKLVIDNSTKSKAPNFNALNNAPPFLYPTGGGGGPCNPCDEIQTLNTKVTVIEGQVSNLYTQVASVNTQVSTINTQISTINTQLGTLGTQVSDLSVQYNGLLSCSYINDSFIQSLLSWKQSGLDIDGEAIYDQSGYSVSVNSTGDIVAISATGNNGNGIDSGHCRVYKFNGTNWVKLGLDIDGEAASDYSGWSVSLNSVGNIVAIGAIGNDGNGNFSGHCRVYGFNGLNWVQMGLDIDGEASGDQFGGSVSLNSIGDTVAIGATNNDGIAGFNTGHCRVYKFNGTNWIQVGLDIDGEAVNDKSGLSVSLNSIGDIVAIGATGNDGNGSSSGHCRVYKFDGTNWVQLGLDIDGASAGDNSGWSVSLNSYGDIVAIGAIFNDGNGAWSGHCRVYKFDGTNWVKFGLDIDGEAAGDQSGISVSLNSIGNIISIGARYNDANGNSSGHCRIYKFNCYTDKWEKIGLDIDGEASFDYSGFSVSSNSNGNIVAIGATGNDATGTISGHCRIYKLSI